MVLRPSIFISHSSKTDAQRQRVQDISAYLKPDFEVLVDYDGLSDAAGERFDAELHRWMLECDGALVLLNKDAMSSWWVAFEQAIGTARKNCDPSFRLLILVDKGAKKSPQTKARRFLEDVSSAGRRQYELWEDYPPERIRAFFSDLAITANADPLEGAKRHLRECLADVTDQTLREYAGNIGVNFKGAATGTRLRACFAARLFDHLAELDRTKPDTGRLEQIRSVIKSFLRMPPENALRLLAPAVIAREVGDQVGAAALAQNPLQRRIEFQTPHRELADQIARRPFSVLPDAFNLATGCRWRYQPFWRTADISSIDTDLAAQLGLFDPDAPEQEASAEQVRQAVSNVVGDGMVMVVLLHALAASLPGFSAMMGKYLGMTFCFYDSRADHAISSGYHPSAEPNLATALRRFLQ